tara:strand:- start:969 stop:2804 length:1836 start_codon:yes stop_codon:yes gene_type:complete
MATTNSNLTINNLDFDTIKSSLKSHLAGQTAFADYNFEGAGINILLDVLAYNTHYEAYYNNMIANEMFLDSAVHRDNIVSIAKHLGYSPSSVRGSEATVNITLGNTTGISAGDYFAIGGAFSATKDGTSYTFVNTNTSLIDNQAANGYHINDLVIKEGKFESYTFVKNTKQTDQKFIIPEKNVDTSTLTVRVQQSVTDDSGYGDSWVLNSNFNEITSTSKVYFVQEVRDNKFEVYFGDGVVGKALDDGNLVILNYVVSTGEVSNNIGQTDSTSNRSFTYGAGNTVVVSSAAAGGADRESIDSIRTYAPLSYQTQNRAVTVDDYKSILINDYPDIESISVWGGEENSPPEYGRVMIAFKPSSGTFVSQQTKDSVVNALIERKNIVGIQAQVVDPKYVYIRVNSEVNFNSDALSTSMESLKLRVKNAILNFGDTSLEKFEKGLRYSKLIKEIDDVDDSILSNETKISMEYRLYPVTDPVKASYNIDFSNPLYHPHDGHSSIISSTAFNYTEVSDTTTRESYLDDDGNGNLRTWFYLDGVKTIINTKIGTINYETGNLYLSNIIINSILEDNFIKIIAQPENKDIDSKKDTILIVDSDDGGSVTVTATPSTYLT